MQFFFVKILFIVYFIDASVSIKKWQNIRLLLAFSSPFVCDTFIAILIFSSLRESHKQALIWQGVSEA